jgi:carboxyl-terminal processing protease
LNDEGKAMKALNFQKKFWIAIIVLALAAISCQTLTNGLDQVIATIPTNTPRPIEQTPEETPEATSTPSNTETSIVTPTATQTLVPVGEQLQLDIFQSLWEAIDQNYLYPDFNGLDWDAIYSEYRQKVEEGLDTEDFYLAMDEMVYRLGDDHSIFLNPQQVQAEEVEYTGEHDYVGIGVWVQFAPEKHKGVILLTFPGGPADQAGIKSRDSILSVEGVALDDDQGLAIDLLLGVEGTPVTLTVQTPGEEPRTMTIPRGRITSSLPVPYELLQTPSGKRIGYIIIPTFSDSTIGEQVGDGLAALSENEPLDGLILDNRLNGGGWDTVMSQTLSYFTSGKVGYFVNREEKEALEIDGVNIGGSMDFPLVVLVGPDTVSFGEIFSGILKDQDRATIIGETTSGNVEVLWGYDFKDGSRAWIAHDTFAPINHPEWDWEDDGIVVDIEIAAPWDEYTSQTDPAIQTALDYLDQ